MADILCLQDVRVVLGGAAVLDGVTLAVAAGEVVLLLGRSGTGKSVLVKAAVGFLPLTSGSVVLDGVPVDPGQRADALRRRVVLVHQDPALLDEETVLDNVALPLRWRTRCRRQDAETRARVELQRLGLDGRSGVGALELSAGERKVVALARALAMDPEMLLLDEPTTGLDAAAAARLGRTLGEIAARGTALLVVTHDLAPFQHAATRVFVLHGGKIVGDEKAPRAWTEPGPALHQFLTASPQGPLTHVPVEA